MDIDFDDLGDCDAVSRQMWISEMEAASAAAQNTGREGVDDVLGNICPLPLAPVDTEGSISFCRCCSRRSGVIEYVSCLISQNMEEFHPLWP